jgi:activator of HSP90 ATPase
MEQEINSVLNYHGRSKDCAQWVIDTFGEAAKKGQYAKNKTMQVWIKQSQEILNKAN